MCGRYYIAYDEEDERMNAILREINHGIPSSVEEGFQPREVFPGSLAPVLVPFENKNAPRLMRWGFPRYGGSGLVINSRSEKSDFTPMFQKAIRERRCLIPVTGFFEWRHTPSGAKKSKEKFSFRSEKSLIEHRPMYLAGIYGLFSGGFEGGGYDGYAILTQAADEQMLPYHDRMPVILEEEEKKKAWLFAPPDYPYGELRSMFTPPRLIVNPAE
ncbi:MAG: SOS response-associated peptidase family protein [Eubacteriales bacterium]|nr:SOS response-associated peptidase family protein [Eubacteriales bacterium]